MPETSADPRIDIRPVTPEAWPDLEAVLQKTSWSRQCWCMVWRAKGPEAATTAPEHRKAAMKARVEGGEPVGLLAYDGDAPIAWCSVAPRETFRNLGGPADFEDEPGTVWSLTCLLVDRAWRGGGVANRLVDAAISRARDCGARNLEAYPVDPDSPSYTYMGYVSQFESRGFRFVNDAGKRRHVYRLDLRNED